MDGTVEMGFPEKSAVVQLSQRVMTMMHEYFKFILVSTFSLFTH